MNTHYHYDAHWYDDTYPHRVVISACQPIDSPEALYQMFGALVSNARATVIAERAANTHSVFRVTIEPYHPELMNSHYETDLTVGDPPSRVVEVSPGTWYLFYGTDTRSPAPDIEHLVRWEPYAGYYRQVEQALTAVPLPPNRIGTQTFGVPRVENDTIAPPSTIAPRHITLRAHGYNASLSVIQETDYEVHRWTVSHTEPYLRVLQEADTEDTIETCTGHNWPMSYNFEAGESAPEEARQLSGTHFGQDSVIEQDATLVNCSSGIAVDEGATIDASVIYVVDTVNNVAEEVANRATAAAEQMSLFERLRHAVRQRRASGSNTRYLPTPQSLSHGNIKGKVKKDGGETLSEFIERVGLEIEDNDSH